MGASYFMTMSFCDISLVMCNGTTDDVFLFKLASSTTSENFFFILSLTSMSESSSLYGTTACLRYSFSHCV